MMLSPWGLVVHGAELLDRRQVPAAEFGRPARHQQARVEQLALPAPRPARQVRGALGRLGAHLLEAGRCRK
jgi:hypothetical protein